MFIVGRVLFGLLVFSITSVALVAMKISDVCGRITRKVMR